MLPDVLAGRLAAAGRGAYSITPNDVSALAGDDGGLADAALAALAALLRALVAAMARVRRGIARRNLSVLVGVACQCYPGLLRAMLAAEYANGVRLLPIQLVRDLGGVENAAMRGNELTLAVLFEFGADRADADFAMRCFFGARAPPSIPAEVYHPELYRLLVEHGADELPEAPDA